jgi:hypothetical protein
MASVRFDTVTGSFVRSFDVPLPSCPTESLPQQTTVPSERRAHVCERPAEMASSPVTVPPPDVALASSAFDESRPVRAPHAIAAMASKLRNAPRFTSISLPASQTSGPPLWMASQIGRRFRAAFGGLDTPSRVRRSGSRRNLHCFVHVPVVAPVPATWTWAPASVVTVPVKSNFRSMVYVVALVIVLTPLV